MKRYNSVMVLLYFNKAYTILKVRHYFYTYHAIMPRKLIGWNGLCVS